LPDRKTIGNRARQPALWVPSTVPESEIERTRWGAEQRTRTMAIVIVAGAQNGTSGALTARKHPRRRTARATPRTGSGRGQVPPKAGCQHLTSLSDLLGVRSRTITAW
jgi:hypothetical protein